MRFTPVEEWQSSVGSFEEAFRKFEPGMSVFVSTGISEPRALVRYLLETQAGNIADLEQMR